MSTGLPLFPCLASLDCLVQLLFRGLCTLFDEARQDDEVDGGVLDERGTVLIRTNANPDFIDVVSQVPQVSEPNFSSSQPVQLFGEGSPPLEIQTLELPLAHRGGIAARREPTDLALVSHPPSFVLK